MRRSRPSTTARAPRRSAGAPSAPPSGSGATLDLPETGPRSGRSGAPFGRMGVSFSSGPVSSRRSRSVHDAGTRVFEPSGRISVRCRPSCRWLQLRIGSRQPSNGWRARTIATAGGNPSRWAVCRGFLRPGEPRRPDGPRGQTGRRSSGVEAHPTVSRRRGHGRRGEGRDGGGDAARLTPDASHAMHNLAAQAAWRTGSNGGSRSRRGRPGRRVRRGGGYAGALPATQSRRRRGAG